MALDTKQLRLVVRVLCRQSVDGGVPIGDLVDQALMAVWETLKTGSAITETDSNNTKVKVEFLEGFNPVDLAEGLSTLADLIGIAEGADVPPAEMCAWLLKTLIPVRVVMDDFTRMTVT